MPVPGMVETSTLGMPSMVKDVKVMMPFQKRSRASVMMLMA
jgi:hypothetical protein